MSEPFWAILSIILFLLWVGVMYLAFLIRHCSREPMADPKKGLRLLTVLGSGGHTTEMLDLLKNFDDLVYNNRTYIVADTDNHSERKALECEQARHGGSFTIKKIPRSREVGQSYISSVFSTAYASLHAIAIVASSRPSLVLVNGPGTCLPVVISSALFDMIRLTNTRIVYVESICRVERLSLTAAILYYSGIADDVIVQWPQLKDFYPRVRTLDEMEVRN